MPKLFLSLFLFTQFIFAQKTYKFTEGELQFIHPQKGIIIKKGTASYKLKLKNISDYDELSKGFNYELENTTFDEIEKLKNDTSTVFSSNIVQYNFKNLNRKMFITNIIDDDNYQLNKYNKDFFSIGILEDSLKKPRNEYLLHYYILEFGNGKKIICHSEGFIVPTKKKINFLFEHFSMNEAFKKYQTTKFKKLTALEIHSSQMGELELNRDFYKIDTLKNKKLIIKNLYNQTVINKSFDSITYNTFFIIGYKNNKLNIYNYTFQKLDVKNVKAFSFERFYPTLQVIENNKLRKINLVGTDFKKNDLSFVMGFSHFGPNQYAEIKIKKVNDLFYIGGTYRELKDSITLKDLNLFHTSNVDSLEFMDESLKNHILLYSEFDYSKKLPFLIYSKLKNGKYNLNLLDYFLSENLDSEMKKINDTLPKNLDFLESVNQDIYLIKKNDLYTYYPIMKEIKYKSLKQFQGNFARFELPNGQKGWLGLDGKEYLDD